MGMRTIRFICFVVFFLTVYHAGAQSLDRVKLLLEQGQYRDAAVILRPLADGGNAEAQLLAAQLFFEGKGVIANEAQGKKYALLSAEQGNEDAMLLLIVKSESSQIYQLAKKYTDQHPYLKKGKIGLILAECYLSGKNGASKNETLGWEIIEKSDLYDQLMQDKKVLSGYWSYKMTQAGKDCLEDYADFLYKEKSYIRYNKLVSYIENDVYNSSAQQLKLKAESGNAWAMARLAKVYDEQGYETIAKSWAQKAVAAGSAYGQSVMEKYNYVPVTYSDISALSAPRYTKIEKITQEWDKTILHMKYTNIQGYKTINTNPNATITCNGKVYKLLRSSLPLSPQGKTMTYNETVYYELVFEGIPKSATSFNLTEGSWKWINVRFRR